MSCGAIVSGISPFARFRHRASARDVSEFNTYSALIPSISTRTPSSTGTTRPAARSTSRACPGSTMRTGNSRRLRPPLPHATAACASTESVPPSLPACAQTPPASSRSPRPRSPPASPRPSSMPVAPPAHAATIRSGCRRPFHGPCRGRIPATNSSPRRVRSGGQILTERREAEVALQNAQAKLAHVMRVSALGELAASIAHEVSQPASRPSGRTLPHP